MDHRRRHRVVERVVLGEVRPVTIGEDRGKGRVDVGAIADRRWMQPSRGPVRS